MLPRRCLITYALLLSFIGSASAQTVNLSEGPLVDNFFRIDMSMKFVGKTRVQQGGESVEQPIAATAQHEYVEKILHMADGIPDKTVRTYKQARAVLRFGDKDSVRGFRPERTLLVSQRLHGQNLTYCPDGSLTRDELELTEHFNAQALTGLLPDKDVKPGDSWPVPRNVAQALCALEGLVSQELQCKLEDVKDNIAQVRVSGSVNGVDLGVEVKIAVQATYQFDLREKRLVLVQWTQKDERDQGPACPALTANVEITVRRGVAEQPPELGAVVLGGKLPQGEVPPPEMTLISYTDPARRFEMQYAHEWIMTAQSDQHTVWRLMNRGDLVAQATVTPWAKRDAGKMMTFADFKDVIDSTPTWKEERSDQKNVKQSIGENFAHQYSAAGKLDGSDVVQHFYLLASPRGDQLFVTFTLSPTQAKEFNFPTKTYVDRAGNFVRKISFPTIESGK